MHRNWTIALVQGAAYAVRNHTGYVATDVEMSAHGPVTVGPFGQTNWRHIYDEILPARAIQEIFGRAWGCRDPVPSNRMDGSCGIRRAENVEITFAA